MLFGVLALLFIIVPVVELQLLWTLGGRIGIFPTLALVVVTGFIGAHLARSQGIRVVNNINKQLQSGEMPGDELISAALVLAGGILLITPGIMTDCVGFLLMIPVTRSILGRYLRKVFAARFNIVNINNINSQFSNNSQGFNQNIKEADVRIVEEDNE